jgi:hypothetical protein
MGPGVYAMRKREHQQFAGVVQWQCFVTGHCWRNPYDHGSAISEEKHSHTVPITPLHVGRNVAANSQMLVRVKEWYAKAIALATYLD